MKKVLLSFFMAVTSIVAMAQKSFTDELTVTVFGESSTQNATIIVEQNADGTYKLALNNFCLTEDMPVGNIILDNISVSENNNIKSLQTSQNIFIAAGDDENQFWLGPNLPEVPVNLIGKMDDEHLYCSINIEMDMEGTPMIVDVVFGEEDKVTSIENIAVENAENVIYDITGRRVNEITKAGIYIVNGKKVLVK